MDESAAFGQLTVVGREGVFKLEADLQTVAEVFNALEAKLGSGVVTRRKVKRVSLNSILTSSLSLLIAVDESFVNRTVEGKVGSGNSAESSESSDGNKSLLKNEIILKEMSFLDVLGYFPLEHRSHPSR